MGLNLHPFAILCYMAVAIGLWVCLVAARRYFEFRNVDSWLVTQGEIIKSGVRFSTTSSSDGTGEPRFHIHVRYQYVVEGKIYTCRRQVLAGPTMMFKHRAFAEGELLRNYKEGSKVRVIYNPSRPHSATLDTTVDNRVLVLFILGGTAISCFASAAYGGLFADKSSIIASMSTSLLMISLVLFGATVYMAIRSSGDRLMHENQL